MEDLKVKHHGIVFDPTVNLGHILTFIGFLVAGFIAYQALEKRVLILETNLQRQEMRDAQQDNDRLRIANETKESLIKIEKGIEKVDSKVDRLVR